MLKQLRTKGVLKKVLWIVSGVIIISFGFGFGISRYGSAVSATSAAGKVFGKTVTIKEFQKYYEDTRDQAILMHGENFKKIQHLLDMDNETWTRIILIREADRRGIKVQDAEVIAFIQTVPFFSRDGAFDRALYERILNYVFQRDPRGFEEGIRDQIKIMKVFHNETLGLRVADETVRKEYERRNKKVQVSYVLIDPQAFAKDIPVAEADVQAYYDGHRAEFLTPDSVNVSYLTIELAAEPAEADKAAALARARDIRKKIADGADLVTTAKENGLAAGESGLISMEDSTLKLGWPLELLQKVFTAKAGEVLEPFVTAQGIVIARVTEQKPAYIPELAKVKDAVRDKITAEKAGALAQTKAEEVRKELAGRLSSGAIFDAAATALGETARKTPFISLGDYIPEIGISEDLESAALELNKDQRLSDVVTTAKGPAILYWEAEEPIDEKKFEDVKNDFASTLNEEQRIAAMNRIVQEVKAQAKLESYLDKLKKK